MTGSAAQIDQGRPSASTIMLLPDFRFHLSTWGLILILLTLVFFPDTPCQFHYQNARYCEQWPRLSSAQGACR